MDTLPKANEFGNYWLDRPAKSPAILRGGKPHGEVRDREHPLHHEGRRWFLSLDSGIVFDADGGIKYFATPLEAFAFWRDNYCVAKKRK